MKPSKVSLLVTVLAMVLMFGAGAVFATQVQAAGSGAQGAGAGVQLRDGSCLTDGTDCPRLTASSDSTASATQETPAGDQTSPATLPAADGQGLRLRDGSCLTHGADCPQTPCTGQQTQGTFSGGHHLEQGHHGSHHR